MVFKKNIMKKIVDLAAIKGYDRFHLDYFKNNKLEYKSWFLEMCLLQKWLRDENNLIIIIEPDQTSYVKYCYDIIKFNGIANFERKTNIEKWKLYKTYEDALQNGLFEALNYINL